MGNREIHVIYGNEPLKMAVGILTEMNIAAELRPGMHVGLKPNLVVARPSGGGATTSPAVVEGVIRYLRSHGIERISIMEGSWVGDSTKRAFGVCGYERLAEQYGTGLFDLKQDRAVVRRVGDLELKICEKALAVDYLINLPVLKAHCQTMLTCALKNLKGCIPDSEKRRYHTLGLMKPIGHLAKALTPQLTLVDAIAGDLTFEEGGNPVQMDRLFAGRDPVLTDAYAASLLGFAPGDIEYIGIAARMGAGSDDLGQARIVEHEAGLKSGSVFRPSDRARQLGRKITAKDACSACYGGLIHALQRLDETGRLRMIQEPLIIGQGFRGQTTAGLGIGQCASGCGRHLPGCPPTARDMVDFLESQIAGRRPR